MEYGFDETRYKRAVLSLGLVDKLPVMETTLLWQCMYDHYFTHHWLRLTEESPLGQGPEDVYQPDRNADLYFENVDIGTPNLAEFAGMAADLWPAFVALSATISAAPKVAVSVYKDWMTARKAEAEIEKIELETKLKQLELDTRTASLVESGKITPENREEKLVRIADVNEQLIVFVPALVTSVEFKLIDSQDD